MPPALSRRQTRHAPAAEVLAAAARAVAAVVSDGRNADRALEAVDVRSDRSAARAVALGTIRWYLRLAPAVGALLERGRKSPDPKVHALLVTAAHQIEYSRHQPEVAVDAAVDATRVLGEARASGFVNAVLRRFVSERTRLLAEVDRDSAARVAHPRWLVEALAAAWPEAADAMLAANNAHPPLVLRVDLNRQSALDCVRELEAAGIEAHAVHWLPSAVLVADPVPVSALPGFADGRVSVQDAGAQLAAPLLDARPGMRVLDACAAPGGKTGHLLERTAGIEVLAVDSDAGRLERVRQNLERLGRTARLVHGDMLAPDAFWDGRPFERVLVDAPCSSTGVIRRHPDIKLLRRASDIEAFARTQLGMLASAFRMLAPGGRLLYVTCSVLPAENEEVVSRFLASEPSARTVPLELEAPDARQGRTGVQLLPGTRAGTDGFHYACLEKATAGT